MSQTKHACDVRRINAYLDEQLGDSDLAAFEVHLTHCESCRSELQRCAAEPEMWRDAAELLGSAGTAHASKLDDQSESQRARHVIGVLDSLSPTDDPTCLGRIADYEVSAVVGVGGMGAVLKGFDKSLRRVVAIKVMAPHLATSGSARARFQREARAAAAITHDNVIDTYGVSEANGLPYLVMPFARGPSLQKRIDDSGPLTPIEVVRIGRQIASGLAAAHEQGLVHRDIKPANILLNEGIERLWITDFGVARAMDDASMTQTGVIAGTPQYMSPEQARGEFVDHRSDLFSMGSILYTACTGRPPFRAEAAYGILRRITDTDPTPIREVGPDTPEWLCRIIERLMAKHPADRFQTASETAQVLEGCLAHLQRPTDVDLPACIASARRAGAPAVMDVKESTNQTANRMTPRSNRFWRYVIGTTVGFALLGGFSFVAVEVTKPTDIGGQWSGESWTHVDLSSVAEAADWYAGAFTDSTGRRGVLQLEWSRLQRRYRGRWKIGDAPSGSVTLRRVGDELRGAIAVDADLPVPAAMPRLRGFSWQRHIEGGERTSQTRYQEGVVDNSTTIVAPLKGHIVRWGGNIQVGAPIAKGDIIAEIEASDPTRHQRLEQQIAAVAPQIAAAESRIVASQHNLEAARAIVVACQSQLQAYETAAAQTSASKEASIRAAKNKVDAANAELIEYETNLARAQAEVEQTQELYDQQLRFRKRIRGSETAAYDGIGQGAGKNRGSRACGK